jgi:hypothetical protein
MRHEMEGRGTVRLKKAKAGSQLSYFVRPDVLDETAR